MYKRPFVLKERKIKDRKSCDVFKSLGGCRELQSLAKKNKTALNTAGPRAPAAAAAAVNTSVFSEVSTDCQRALVRLRCK